MAQQGLSKIERLKAIKDLFAAKKQLVGLKALQKAKVVAEILRLRAALGFGKESTSEPPSPATTGGSARQSTAQFYTVREKGQGRQRLNNQALALMRKIDAEHRPATVEEKAVLAKYSGNGGGLIGADGKKGSAYEYYTPMPIAEGIWDALRGLGFAGGKVLDPSAGTGIFGASAPLNAAVDAVELDATSGRINQLVNDGPGYQCIISSFEKVAASTPDGIYDAVVTNVPFGDTAARGGNQYGDDRYQDEPLENYFILRSLEKLRPGGLAAFIAPTRCVSGKGGKPEELRLKASFLAEFIGAYRLPTGTFSTASTDTVTDVIFFRKYRDEAADKITELAEQDAQKLHEAKVLWDTFLDGKWFDSAEGRPYMLGEFVAKDPSKFRDVDKVISNAGLTDLREILAKRKLPASRVDWKLLDAAETMPIVYQEGDTITQAGVTLVLRDGVWVALPKDKGDEALDGLLGQMATPYDAYENHLGLADFTACLEGLRERSRFDDVPSWARGLFQDISLVKEDKRLKLFEKGVIALAVREVREERKAEVGLNYLAEYPNFSVDFKKARISKADVTYAKAGTGYLACALQEAMFYYDKKDKSGFGRFWRGDVPKEATQAAAAGQTPAEKIAAIRYARKTQWLTIAEAKSVMGDDFDPLTAADWCVSADGSQVMPADDYYIGNYGEFLGRIDQQIAAAADDNLKNKLIRQKNDARQRVHVMDVSALTYNLFTPYVTPEEKAEFLRQFVSGYAKVATNAKDGRPYPDIDIPNPKNDEDKLLNRFGDYLKNGSLTLGGLKLDRGDAEALQYLRDLSVRANEQFNAWVKSNAAIQARMQAKAENPDNLRFVQTEDTTDLKIPGLNPQFHLHSYQAAFVRKMGRDFSGINGFGVGLGKTFTALAAVQHVQSIGVKKKTLFVVPKSVLSNWRKEAVRAYANTDDCLFVGLRLDKNGAATIKASNFDEDLQHVTENMHSKIFMTLEAFERIKLRDDTIAAYGDYTGKVDASFAESMDKKKDENTKSKRADLLSVLHKKAGAAPYLEDMGVDSLVIDEAHFFKNSASTVKFKGAQYLSLSPASKRGIDAQCKAWYIRGRTSAHDGVLLLTATPITNSPLEIYSMLSLAVGPERVNASCGGTRGADDFMDVFCEKVNREAALVDGTAKAKDVFVGLQNAECLREAIGEVATIKSAKDVATNIFVPERENEDSSGKITLTPETCARLALYKEAYRWASDALSEREPNRGDEDAYKQVAAFFGEPEELIGHPFNLIRKMTYLIADPDLDKRATFYQTNTEQRALAARVVEEFNAKGISEVRTKETPYQQENNVSKRTQTKDEDGNVTEEMTVHIVAELGDDGRIVLDTMDYAVQQQFEALADKAGLELNVSIPPKLAALIENVKAEMAHPRGLISQDPLVKSPIVKQIIFCDILPWHSKIKRLMTQKAGIPAAKIAIITGQTNGTPDEILDVQEGFNAQGADNRYQLVIANEKAEVGINLQKGTQAVHHLTIGWTPDSLEQRNGRAARQGNMTVKVKIYTYEANGTFDTMQRQMVEHKADWIGNLLSAEGGNNVEIAAGYNKEDAEVLIEASGDANAMRRAQELKERLDREARIANVRSRQRINLDTMKKQTAFLAAYETVVPFIGRTLYQAYLGWREYNKTLAKITKAGANQKAIDKLTPIAERQKAALDALCQTLSASASFGYGTEAQEDPRKFFAGRRRLRDSHLLEEGVFASDYQGAIQPKESGPLIDDWQAALTQAKNMLAQSRAAFAELSKSEGGYPADVADAHTELFGNQLFVDRGFVRYKHAVGIYDPRRWRSINFYNAATHAMDSVALSLTGTDCVPVYAGSSQYEQCLRDAAAAEDEMAQAGTKEAATFFSTRIPAVTQYRQVSDVVWYGQMTRLLPPPYFPYVLWRDPARSSELIRALMEQQAKIVVRSRETFSRWFGISKDRDETVPFTGEDSDWTWSCIAALYDYAKAQGIKLVRSDFGLTEDGIAAYLVSQVGADAIRAAMQSVSGEAPDGVKLLQAVADMMAEKLPHIDFAHLSLDGMPQMLLEDPTIGSLLKEEVQRRKPTKPDTAAEDNDPEKQVLIVGQTYDWRLKIKQAANDAGDRARWNRTQQGWVVKRKSWDRLLSQYPEARNDLNLAA